MTTQAKTRDLAREALKLVQEKAPAIVDEQILAHMLDEVAEYTGDIMGKLTNLDADNEKNITMAHGIIYDGLLNEVITQIRDTMHAAAGKRLDKFETLSKK
jgi:hypothetical protein